MFVSVLGYEMRPLVYSFSATVIVVFADIRSFLDANFSNSTVSSGTGLHLFLGLLTQSSTLAVGFSVHMSW